MSDLTPPADRDPEAPETLPAGMDAPADESGPTLADFAQPSAPLVGPDLSEFEEEPAVVAGPDLSDFAEEPPAVAGPELSDFAADGAEEPVAVAGPDLSDFAEEPAAVAGPDLSDYARVEPEAADEVDALPAGPDLSDDARVESEAADEVGAEPAGPDPSDYARVEPEAADDAHAEAAGPNVAEFEDDASAELTVADGGEPAAPDLSGFEDDAEAAAPAWSPALDADPEADDGDGTGVVPYDPPDVPADDWGHEELTASVGDWHPSLVESDSDDHAALPPPTGSEAGSSALSLEGGSGARRFGLRAPAVNPRLLVLVGLLAVAGAAFALTRGGGDDAASPASVAAAPHPPTAAKSAPGAHGTPGPAAGWSRVSVPAGRFTVDVPPGYRQAVNGPLVTFTASAGTRAYAVNGSATDAGAASTAVRRLVSSYRHDYRLVELSTRATGAGAVEVAARGVRRGTGVRQRILAAVFRAPKSAHGLLVVQSFSNDAAARQDRAGRAEFERVRRTVRLAG